MTCHKSRQGRQKIRCTMRAIVCIAPVLIRATISQNLRTPRKFFLVVLVLVLVLDWVSGLDYEDEDDDEDDSVAAAPLRVHSWFFTAKRLA